MIVHGDGGKEDVPSDVTIVRFHSSVTEVSREIFRYCYLLKKVVLNEGLQKIGNQSFYKSTLLEIGERAFCLCSKLKKVVFNEGLQKIGIRSFWENLDLEHINLPSTLTEIGESAFYNCRNIREVVLNDELQTIGLAAFSSCTSLEHITIPSTVTEIGVDTFYYCISLREVGLHEGIQKIHPRAFERCSSLEIFKFPSLSTRLDNIIQAGQTEAEDKIDHINNRGTVERRGSEMFISDVVSWVQVPNWWIPIKSRIGRIDQLITYYELKEATTLLELAMWKSKMNQAEVKPSTNRDVYRIDIPGPVKNNILQYLNFRV